METANNANEARVDDLSKRIIGCALSVASTLGSGFAEKVYEKALAYEIRKRYLAVRNNMVSSSGMTVSSSVSTRRTCWWRARCLSSSKPSRHWTIFILPNV